MKANLRCEFKTILKMIVKLVSLIHFFVLMNIVVNRPFEMERI